MMLFEEICVASVKYMRCERFNLCSVLFRERVGVRVRVRARVKIRVRGVAEG
jgi:hypothetical protein